MPVGIEERDLVRSDRSARNRNDVPEIVLKGVLRETLELAMVAVDPPNPMGPRLKSQCRG